MVGCIIGLSPFLYICLSFFSPFSSFFFSFSFYWSPGQPALQQNVQIPKVFCICICICIIGCHPPKAAKKFPNTKSVLYFVSTSQCHNIHPFWMVRASLLHKHINNQMQQHMSERSSVASFGCNFFIFHDHEGDTK